MKTTLEKAIENQNAKFKKLKSSEKRVAIAKDAIKSVKLGIYIPSPGNYFYATKVTGDNDERVNLQETLIDKKPIECHVCAMGAIFASKVKLGNSARDLIGSGGSSRFHDCGDLDLVIRDVFAQKQLNMIECVFEGWNDFKGTYKWIEKYPNHSERMIAIMKNIVRNKGTFKVLDI